MENMLRFGDLPIWGAYQVVEFQTGRSLFSHAENEPGDYPPELATAIVTGIYAFEGTLIVEV